MCPYITGVFSTPIHFYFDKYADAQKIQVLLWRLIQLFY